VSTCTRNESKYLAELSCLDQVQYDKLKGTDGPNRLEIPQPTEPFAAPSFM